MPPSGPQEIRHAPLPPDEVEPGSTIGINEGLEIHATGDFALRIGGTVQIDEHQIDAGDARYSSWLVRRGALGFGGAWAELIEFRIDTEWSSLPAGPSSFVPRRLGIHNAYVGFNFAPSFQIRAGQMKTPFESEYTFTSDRFMDFAERSWVYRIVPGRDVGLMAYGNLFAGAADYGVGVFNGATNESGTKNALDVNTGKDVIGQVRVRPFTRSTHESLRRLQLGGGYAWGPSRGDDTLIVFGAETALNVIDVDDRLASGDHRSRWVTECYWFYGPVSVKGEFVHTSTDLVGGGMSGTLDASAYFASVTWLLTGETKGQRRTAPSRPVASRPRGRGAWELGLRYSALDRSMNAAPGSDPGFAAAAGPVRSARSWVVGLTWQLHLMSRLMLEYAHDDFDVTPDQVLAKPPPDQADAVILRLQVDF